MNSELVAKVIKTIIAEIANVSIAETKIESKSASVETTADKKEENAK